jgi:LacI family gluconate utilization system Gnt-I transcriptional repressor
VQRSGRVAAIVPTLSSAISAETVDAPADGLRAHGLQLLIGLYGHSIETEAAILRTLLGLQPVAVVLTGTHHAPGCARCCGRGGCQGSIPGTWPKTRSTGRSASRTSRRCAR